MAGDADVVEKLKKGYQAIGRTYKNHIDGVNLLPYLTGREEHSPRKLFFYISDDGDILALRFDNWKVVFMEQRCAGTLKVWGEPFTRLRLPKIYNLRTDPYEFADVTSNSYLRVVPLPRLHPVRRVHAGRQVRRNVQGVPDHSEAEQLHDRRSDQDAVRERRRRPLAGAPA